MAADGEKKDLLLTVLINTIILDVPYKKILSFILGSVTSGQLACYVLCVLVQIWRLKRPQGPSRHPEVGK